MSARAWECAAAGELASYAKGIDSSPFLNYLTNDTGCFCCITDKIYDMCSGKYNGFIHFCQRFAVSDADQTIFFFSSMEPL